MFIYLSKKIAIPNNVKLTSLYWSKERGYIACGGEDGMLKVLKLDSQPDGKVRGLAAPSSLSMNQTLEGHSGSVMVVTWNDKNVKLTTSDQNGLIIVWMLNKGSWFEEMINNRNKSVVTGMAWNKEGEKICIVYEDGAVIVGSVDGNRIWGKELKTVLTHVEWSPDSKHLLFAMSNSEIHIYDATGNFMSKVSTDFFPETERSTIASLVWYYGNTPDENVPCLAICFSNGKGQLMRHELDNYPVLIDTNMKIVCAAWSHNGASLAIAGKQTTSEKKANVVQIFTRDGELLRSLRVPGNNIAACSWEGTGLRIAMAVDSHIYFANIRPKYRWGYCTDSVIYEYYNANIPERIVVFWNVKFNEIEKKFVRRLMGITACGDYCCLSAKQADGEAGKRDEYVLTLCNCIGSPMESRSIYFEPVFLTMTRSHVIVAGPNVCYVWKFIDPVDLLNADVTAGFKDKVDHKERLLHIDEPGYPSPISFSSWSQCDKETSDPISSVGGSSTILLIGRQSAVMHVFSLPQLEIAYKIQLNVTPFNIVINCNSTRAAITDISGVLTIWDLNATSSDAAGNRVRGKQLKCERKDVWDACWAEDNPILLAVMEKTRMYIIRDVEPEEPVVTSGYLCRFENLQIRSVLLDEVLATPDIPQKENIVDLETRSLRDLHDMIGQISLEDTKQYIQDNPHPRLWSILADAALDRLDLETAETALVQCKDYAGIQFIKRLRNVQSEALRKAEVCAYRSKFDDAEQIYIELDRKDLAVDLRQKLGDWFRVIQLLKTGSDSGDDSKLIQAFNAIGDYYSDRQHWIKAIPYYKEGRNHTMLAHCYYNKEDFVSLQKMIDHLPDNHPLLPDIGQMFVSVGMCKEAVMAFQKCGRVAEAIDACIFLNEWDQGVQLAKASNSKEIDNMLARYATQLLDKGKTIAAIELYKSANRYIDAAKKLFEIAKEEQLKGSKVLRVKKLYVLAAKLVEMHRDKPSGYSYKQKGSEILAGLLDENVDDSKMIERAWRGAEAYHFFILAQRQLYNKDPDSAMRTAQILSAYEDLIPPIDIYSLLALAAAQCRAYDVCSQAFVKLETIENVSDEQREQFEEIASQIFLRHPPKSTKPSLDRVQCLSCHSQSLYPWSTECENDACAAKYSVCIVTGRPIFKYKYWVCPSCKHKADTDVLLCSKLQWCPLCHMECLEEDNLSL